MKKKRKPNEFDMLKACKDLDNGVKPKKKRKAPVRKSATNDMVEKRLESDIIFELDLHNYVVAKSGEFATYHSKYVLSGMSDLIVFCQKHGIVFMEVKQPSRRNEKNGGLRDTQVKFRDTCKKYCIKYCVVYSVDEALKEVGHENHW